MSEALGTGGVMIMGGVDKALYEGPITWITIPRLESLSVVAGKMTLGDTTVFRNKVTVLFDSKV
jgi:hypothetical protein